MAGNPSFLDQQELELMLRLVRVVREQIQAGKQPDLAGELKKANLKKAEITKLAGRWAEMVENLLGEDPEGRTILLERDEILRDGCMRFLLAVLLPDYRERLLPQPADPSQQSHASERRSTISITREELQNLLRATLVEAPFPADE
jgi:hypothetical protein